MTQANFLEREFVAYGFEGWDIQGKVTEGLASERAVLCFKRVGSGRYALIHLQRYRRAQIHSTKPFCMVANPFETLVTFTVMLLVAGTNVVDKLKCARDVTPLFLEPNV